MLVQRCWLLRFSRVIYSFEPFANKKGELSGRFWPETLNGSVPISSVLSSVTCVVVVFPRETEGA